MRYRLNEYTIVGNTIELYTDVTIEDIRLIVNETQGVVICSSMQKSNITSVTTRDTGFSTITIPTSVCELAEGDKLTIEIDKGESLLLIENKVDSGIASIADKINDTAKESTLNEVSAKIENINVDVDLSSVAKQGTNDNATNTAILDAVSNVQLDKSDLAKQGENAEATNSKIYESLGDVTTALTIINDTLGVL